MRTGPFAAYRSLTVTATRVLIVGAGPGGLATALALRRAGIDPVVVVEQAAEQRSPAAGVLLWPNAVKLLRDWGVGAAVEDRGARALDCLVRTPAGRPIVTLGFDGFEARFGAPLVVVHCASLRTILEAALAPGSVRLGSECIGVEQDARGAAAVLRDGSRWAADVVVGADGAASAVRAAVTGDGAGAAHHAGVTAWRGVVPLDRTVVDGLLTGEWWGRGAVFGIARLGGNQAYWWATVGCPPTAPGSIDQEKADLLHRFARWQRPIHDLIDASPPEAIIRTPLRRRRSVGPRGAGRVALVGDAAAIALPSLSQGACQAIEDAATLADCLLTDSVVGALERYGDRRRGPERVVARRSARLSRWEHLTGPVASSLRNVVLRTVRTDTPVNWLAPIIGHEPIGSRCKPLSVQRRGGSGRRST